MKKTYYIISGEGEKGKWERHHVTERKILNLERCGGDRFARAYTDLAETKYGEIVGYDIETGEEKIIPDATQEDLKK